MTGLELVIHLPQPPRRLVLPVCYSSGLGLRVRGPLESLRGTLKCTYATATSVSKTVPHAHVSKSRSVALLLGLP